MDVTKIIENNSKYAVILLPTYNERHNVKIIIPKIFSLLPEINILVIDDNSPDKTFEIVEELMKQYKNLKILKRQNKTGLGNAYKDGMKQTFNDNNIKFVITMDADGSHEPKFLNEFLNEVNNYDLIIGSRYVDGGGTENWELWRKKLSFFGNFYAKLLTGLNVNDLTAGFICAKRDILEKVDFNEIGANGYSYQIELKFYLINKLKAKFKEIPIIFKERIGGESKMSIKIIIEGFGLMLHLLIKRLK